MQAHQVVQALHAQQHAIEARSRAQHLATQLAAVYQFQQQQQQQQQQQSQQMQDPHLQAHLCEPQPHHHHHQQQQVKRQRVGAGPGSNGIGTLGILGGGMPNGGARGDTSVHTGGHTGGQRAGGSSGAQCNHDGCMKQARRPTRFCVRHGGGRRCIVLDCPKAAAGQTNKCVAHGGGKRCQAPGCTKASQCAAGLCKAHGGGRRCCEPGCRKSAQGRTGMCRAHAVARKQADRDRSGNHLDPSSAAGKASSLRGGVPGGGGDHGFNPLGDAPGVASAFHGVSTNGGGTHTTNPVGGGGGRSTTATDPAPGARAVSAMGGARTVSATVCQGHTTAGASCATCSSDGSDARRAKMCVGRPMGRGNEANEATTANEAEYEVEPKFSKKKKEDPDMPKTGLSV